MNWDNYPNFSEHEFKCSCCGETRMSEDFIERLQDLRDRLPAIKFVITSGYRCPNHPAEQARAQEGRIGSHTTGRACDLLVQGADAYAVIRTATGMGFTGLGVAQKGATGRFIHLDTLTDTDYNDHHNKRTFPRPMVWSY